MRRSLVFVLIGLLVVAVAAMGRSQQAPADNPRVVLDTEMGQIEIEIDAARAPLTAANFLKYVDGGFYRGGRLGVHRGTVHKDEGHTFGLGIDIGYAWLLGANQNFYIGLGIGATRFFGGDLKEDRVVLPSIRLLNIGFAF